MVSQSAVNVHVPRIFLEQDLELLDALGYFAGHRGIVPSGNEIFFGLDQPIAQQVSPTHAFERQAGLSLIAITKMEKIVGGGKVLVQLNGMLKKGNRSRISFFGPRPGPCAVRLQSFE